MKIKSTVAEATKYSTDALEAFYTAVENGQARLALLILVDVIEEFASRFDALEVTMPSEIKAETVVTKDEIKPSETNSTEDKPAPKAKAVAKENAAD